jgi:hypothetical protein
MSGPAAIAVTRPADPLPCGLVTGACTAQAGVVACVDGFFADDGTCGTTAVRTDFAHFVALPKPNDYGAQCAAESPPCDLTQNELRFALDTAGNVLVPFDWSRILVESNQIPVPRLLRLTVSAPITIPGASFVASYTPEGALLPPIFEPQADPSPPADLKLFGSADAPYTILRLARRSENFLECGPPAAPGRPCNQAADCPAPSACGPTTCRGGSNDGGSCTSDVACPGGECGPPLFDFTALTVAGSGPVALHQLGTPCGATPTPVCQAFRDCSDAVCNGYTLSAELPVPLDGLVASPDVLVFVANEFLAGRDLDGDGDVLDARVVTLRDRDTGLAQPIGPGGSDGFPAATFLQAGPFVWQTLFAFPAVAATSTWPTT